MLRSEKPIGHVWKCPVYAGTQVPPEWIETRPDWWNARPLHEDLAPADVFAVVEAETAARAAAIRAEDEAAFVAFTAQLAALVDPVTVAVLAHHAPHPTSDRSAECYGCDSCCQTAGWPCSTVTLIAERHGITVPDFTRVPKEPNP